MKPIYIRVFSCVILIGLLLTIPFPTVSATETQDTLSVEGSYYEFDGNGKYDYSGKETVNGMTYGQASLGQLSITGVDMTQSTYAGTTAYGVSGSVSFSYTYNSALLNAADDEWHLVEDKEKKIAGQKIESDMLKGVLIIQKSSDGKTFENAVNPLVNFFASNISGKELYKTSGEDVSQGTYYRFIIAYKTAKKDGKFLFWDQYSYKRHMEIYDFYVVENSGVISIHNLSIDEELLEMDGYDQELLKRGETLVNNSITRDGFEIEKITSSYTVKVQRDSGYPQQAETGDRFTEDGKYTITVTTKLGKQNTTTVYVFKGGSDKGFTTYFGQGLVQAERVFREGSAPTYARGGQICLQPVDSVVPPLYGTLVDVNTNEVVYELSGGREEQTYSLAPGSYIAEFYNADPEIAGSFYHYSFAFTVLDEESAPYVNYHNLMATQRLEDLQTKHYEVSYQTTSGGYIYVCFSLDSYEEALAYAREIEGRFVEQASDGGFYYKDAENPNRKIKYYDPVELTNAREKYAIQNVEISYFNAKDEFTYRTYDNDLLDCLEDLNISTSIKVFPSQEEKEKMCDRTPYINNFTFIQASDYDVVSVTAQHKASGVVTDLQFGVPVAEQLEASGEYTITETNSYGRTRTYTAYFVTECSTQMTWFIEADGVTQQVEVSADSLQDGAFKIDADSAYVAEISNLFDEWAIVTVKAPGVYSFEIKCLATEFTNLEFNKAGTYEIAFVDRLGNSFTVTLCISGEVSYADIDPINTSYVAFYNNLYLNHQDTDEDLYSLEELALLKPQEDISDEITEPTTEPNPTGGKDFANINGENNYLIPIVVGSAVIIVILAGSTILIRKRKKRTAVPVEHEEEECNDEE